jgi:hypothetical protein
MMNIISKLAVVCSVLCLAMLPMKAYADDSALFRACNANTQTQSSTICQSKGTKTNPVNHIINVAASIVAILTGIAAVIFIILGGLTMVTSRGNTEAVTNARKRIIYAVVGLIIVTLAWAAITFLTNKLIHT